MDKQLYIVTVMMVKPWADSTTISADISYKFTDSKDEAIGAGIRLAQEVNFGAELRSAQASIIPHDVIISMAEEIQNGSESEGTEG